MAALRHAWRSHGIPPPAQVDHLMLRGNKRYVHTRAAAGDWATTELNP